MPSSLPSLRSKTPSRILLVGEAVPQLGEAWRLAADVRPDWFFAVAGTLLTAQRHLEEHAFHAVIVDGGEMGVGGEVLRLVRQRWPDTKRVAVVSRGAWAHPESHEGCAVVGLPVRPAMLLATLDDLLGPPVSLRMRRDTQSQRPPS